MFVDKATGRLWVITAEGVLRYLYIAIDPLHVIKDPTHPTMTEAFTVTVQVWYFGKNGSTPEDGVNKKDDTQSYVINGDIQREVCYTDQTPEATQDTEYNGSFELDTPFVEIEGVSLYKSGWDGSVEITAGEGAVTGLRYKTDDDSEFPELLSRTLIQGS